MADKDFPSIHLHFLIDYFTLLLAKLQDDKNAMFRFTFDISYLLIQTNKHIHLSLFSHSKTTEKKNPNENWTEENLDLAIQQILSNEISEEDAAVTFDVPREILRDRLESIQPSETDPIKTETVEEIVNSELEEQLILYTKDQEDRFLSFGNREFGKFAYDLATHLKIPHSFCEEKQTADENFYHRFIQRNPTLTTRNSANLQEALGFDKPKVDAFFDKYRELLTEFDYSPSKIYNCDKSVLSFPNCESDDNIVPPKINPEDKMSASTKGNTGVSVLICINAAGNHYVPPLFVLPSEQQVNTIVTKDAPAESIFTVDENSLISGGSFLKWLEVFVEQTHPAEEQPVLLIVNNQPCHQDLNVILFAKEHHLHLLSLPPLTAHKMQPLNRAILQSFSEAYNQACNDLTTKYHPRKITEKDFAGLASAAYASVCRMDSVQHAFKCTGLWPLNPDVFGDSDFDAIGNFQGQESSAPSLLADTPFHFMEICESKYVPY